MPPRGSGSAPRTGGFIRGGVYGGQDATPDERPALPAPDRGEQADEAPDGVRLILGAPALIPPPRPETAETAATEAGPEAADDRLAGFRPRLRPGDLTQTTERARLGGLTLSQLSERRPAARPLSYQETARALDDAAVMADSQTLQGQAAALEAYSGMTADELQLESDLKTATDLAVATSGKPRLRPANISQIAARARSRAEAEEQATQEALAAAERAVERARTESAAAAAAEKAAISAAEREMALRAKAQAAAKAKAAAEAQARAQATAKAEAAARAKAEAQAASAARARGPAVARSERAKPTGAISATVAKRATTANVLPLGKVSLVGVFGTSSQRRALVRLPSGKYQRVKVGDRIDGGRVAAIGQKDLRYTKGGRNITLKMPKG